MKAGDWSKAERMAASLAQSYPLASSDASKCRFLQSEALFSGGAGKKAAEVLKELLDTPGISRDDEREATRRLIRILYTSAGSATIAERSAVRFLKENPWGPESSKVRLLYAQKLVKDSRLHEAIVVIQGRSKSDAALPEEKEFVALLAAAGVSLRNHELEKKEAPAALPYQADTARRAFASGDFKEASRLYEMLAADASGAPNVRMAYRLRRWESLEGAGDMDTPARESMMFARRDDLPVESRVPVLLCALRYSIDSGRDVPEIASWAAQLAASPDKNAAEDARWLLARFLARKGGSEAEVVAALRGSAKLAEAEIEEDSPAHPARRLIALNSDSGKWLDNDLGEKALSDSSTAFRIAAEYFAATRYDRAAKAYAALAGKVSRDSDLHAFVRLQEGRSLALDDHPTEAVACFRRFLTEKPLMKSRYASAALLRAGVLCDNPLRDTKTAIFFYRETVARDPAGFSGQSAWLYLADSLAESGKRNEAADQCSAYLKRFPSGEFAQAMRERLANLHSAPTKK